MLIEDAKLKAVLETIQIDDIHNLTSPNVLQLLEFKDEVIKLELCVFNPSLHFKNKIKKEIEKKVLKEFPGISINISFSNKKTIKNTIAIASGKGGVGKSTIASNLAVALKNKGYKVGLLDADIYGPSIPLMFDAENERPKKVQHGDGFLMSPIVSYGVKIMSIGFFLKPNDALVWRGPMATKALKEILHNTDWGYLDYLLIDLPPGTGDIHLSLVQTLSISGAIIVTTPQPVSIIDAKKAINMFKKEEINVPILGLVENMSWFLIDNTRYYIFGQEGGRNLSESENVKLLSQLPLDQSIREAGDIGRPAALQESKLSEKFNHLAESVNESVSERNKDFDLTKKVPITHNRGCN
tara:strand:+ start:406 stop:1467 length:1062 start_codon:yes stop_codon:yes gene_type:complete